MVAMEEPHPEQNDTPEREVQRALEALPNALGYTETEEMIGLHRELVVAMAVGEDTRERALRYRLLAEQAAELAEASSSGSARLGMLIGIAIMRRDGGRYDAYFEDLEDALIVAEQEGFEDAALVLRDVLDMS